MPASFICLAALQQLGRVDDWVRRDKTSMIAARSPLVMKTGGTVACELGFGDDFRVHKGAPSSLPVLGQIGILDLSPKTRTLPEWWYHPADKTVPGWRW